MIHRLGMNHPLGTQKRFVETSLISPVWDRIAGG
jgi:hypothetical protein